MNSIQLGALDHYFADFINSIDEAPSEALWLAAAMVSFANCQGHVCLDLPGSTGLEVLPYRQPIQSGVHPPQMHGWQRFPAAARSVLLVHTGRWCWMTPAGFICTVPGHMSAPWPMP
jgi:hypothetical protein